MEHAAPAHHGQPHDHGEAAPELWRRISAALNAACCGGSSFATTPYKEKLVVNDEVLSFVPAEDMLKKVSSDITYNSDSEEDVIFKPNKENEKISDTQDTTDDDDNDNGSIIQLHQDQVPREIHGQTPSSPSDRSCRDMIQISLSGGDQESQLDDLNRTQETFSSLSFDVGNRQESHGYVTNYDFLITLPSKVPRQDPYIRYLEERESLFDLQESTIEGSTSVSFAVESQTSGIDSHYDPSASLDTDFTPIQWENISHRSASSLSLDRINGDTPMDIIIAGEADNQSDSIQSEWPPW